MVDQQAPDPETEAKQSQQQNEQAKAGESPDSEVADQSNGEVSVELLKQQLEEARAEAEEQKNIALRAVAEGQNARRRAENEVSNARKFALERFVADVLPTLDSLERGIEAVDTDEAEGPLKALYEGSVLTLKMMLDVLAKHNVLVVDPVGEPFDPEHHEAMTMVESPDAEPNSVLAVMQKGYSLNGRLVRPARVVVSKAPA
ncbi:MAG TPA: nucleotide exchange factor GrpE [Pseudomonadales bacterium]